MGTSIIILDEKRESSLFIYFSKFGWLQNLGLVKAEKDLVTDQLLIHNLRIKLQSNSEHYTQSEDKNLQILHVAMRDWIDFW